MKRIIFGITTLWGCPAPLPASETQPPRQAADAQKTFHYEGRIAGVVCVACSSSVKEALMSLDGVTDVRITVSKDGSLPRLEITSTSPALTREAAMKALGSAAADYQIQSLEKTHP